MVRAHSVAVDCFIGQQLGQVALGHQLVEQIRAVIPLGVFVLGLDLAHFLLKFDNRLEGRRLVALGRRGFEQGFGVGYGDGVAGHHVLHSLHLQVGRHVA